MRLDIYLAEKGFVSSRARAKMEIENGNCFVNGKVITKPAHDVTSIDKIEIKNALKWVSRGGLKLEKSLSEFGVDPSGKTVLDIGSSTGGFSDVVLTGGAKQVYCVDTGTNILDAKIRKDKRVTVFEQTDYRNLEITNLQKIDLVVIDVSFISLKVILEKLECDFSGTDVEIITLIKPQFEVGMQLAKKYKGIIKDEKLHKKVVDDIKNAFFEKGFICLGLTTSPILGGDGNTEFLAYFKSKK